MQQAVEDAHLAGQQDIVQLKKMINQQRQAMDQMGFAQLQGEDDAKSAAHQIQQQLQQVASAQRDQMDRMCVDHDMKLERMKVRARNDCNQLEATVRQLRLQLEEGR